MIRYILSILLGTLAMVSSFAQGPIFQDKAGETSIQTGDNALFINSGDASIGFQLSKAVRNTRVDAQGITTYKPQVEFGGNIKAKATEGVSSVFDDGKLKIGFDVTGFYRRAFRGTPRQPDQNASWYITGKYSRAQHNVLQSNSVNFDGNTFSVLQFTVGITGFDSAPFLKGDNSDDKVINSTFVYGVSFGYGGFSNFENLLPVEQFTLLTTGVAPQTTSQTVVLKDKRKAVQGNYVAGEGFRFNADFFYFPQAVLQGRIGLGGNYRILQLSDYQTNNTSVGIVVNASKISNQVLLGLFYQINDVFSQGETTLKNQLNFVAGYKFQ